MALSIKDAERIAKQKFIKSRLSSYSQKQQNLIDRYGNYNQADWHTQDEANAYYNALQEVRDLTDLYRYYVDTYESGNKALSGQLGTAVENYDSILSGKNDFLDLYSQYTNPKDFNAAYAHMQETAKKYGADNYSIEDKEALLDQLYKDKEVFKGFENAVGIGQSFDMPISDGNGNDIYFTDYFTEYDKNADLSTTQGQKDALESLNLDTRIRELEDELRTARLFQAPNLDDLADFSTYSAPTRDAERALKRENLDKHLTDEERARYYYLYNTQGADKATQYAEDLTATLESRQLDAIRKWSGKNIGTGILGTLASFGTSAASMLESIGDQSKYFMSGGLEEMDDIYTARMTDAYRSGVTDNLGGFGDFVYGVGTSAVESYLASLIPGGGLLLGANAAASAINSALDRGATSEQAFFSGLAAGAFETLFESFSIERLKSVKKIIEDGGPKALKDIVKQVAVSMGVEASEEAATEAANLLYDTIALGDISNYALAMQDYIDQGMSEDEARKKVNTEFGLQIGEAALSGAVMGGVKTGAKAVETNARVAHAKNKYFTEQGKNILNSPDAESIIEEYKYAAKEFKDVDSVAKATGKYNKKATASNLGRLEEEIRAEYTKRSGMSWEQQKKEISKAAAEEKKALAERASADVQKTMSEAHSEAQRLKLSRDGRSGVTLGKMPAIVDYSGASSNNITIKDADGNEVKLSEAKLADDDVGVAYILASQLGSVDAANAFIKAYNAESEQGYISPDGFYVDWLSIQSHGQISTWEGAMEKAFSAVGDRISEASKGAAFLAGRGLRESVSQKYEAEQAKYDNAWKEVGGNTVNATFKDTALRGKTLSQDQQDYRSFLRAYSRAMGTNVEVFYSEKGARKENGSYNRGTNTLRIDINAGISNKATYDAVQNNVIGTLSHETVHNMRVTAPKQYEALRDFVTTELEKNTDYDLEKNVEDEIARYAAKGQKISREDAIEEIVARACEDRLGSSEALRDFLADLYAHDKDAANGFVKAVKEFLTRLKEFFEKIAKMKSTAPEAQKFAEMGGDIVSELQKLFDEGVLAMREGNMARNAVKALGIEISTATESAEPMTMLSEATWRESEYATNAKQAAEALAKALDVTPESALKYINNVNSIAKMIANDRARLDYVASSFGSAFVSNVEYGGSFDYTTLCKKRRLFTGTFSEIQKRLGEVALTPDQILEIRNLLIDAGLEAPCGLCYVEGSRANMGKFAKEFIKLYKRDNPNAWIPNMADVNTPDGVEQMRIKHPECYERYEYFWNHYGKLKDSDPALFASQQKPKLYEARKAYEGEILKQFSGDTSVEKKNRRGGIRMQSFSDFEIIHAIDTMQVIMDMSRVGLAGQAYTKVPEFAKAFGDTGLKINLSLIAKGIDENGKLIFDDREGMPHETAFDIRKKHSKNVGTIIVVFNDKQLYAAMADDRIDFIIPFHRSQWKKGQYAAMGLPEGTKDYTYMQNEKLLKQTYHEYQGRMVKDKASNYMPNEYWHPDKTGKENAELYLQMCADNNKRPKFYKLLDYDGKGKYSLKADGSTDGYWKLLIDFKMYDNDGNYSPQLPVRPDFSMGEIRKMLKEYEGGHSSYPIAHDVVDKFVEGFNKGKSNTEWDTDSYGATMFQDRDTDYLDAVNRGDMEKAQRMVDEAAKEAGYSTEHLYHGTSMFGFTDIDVSSASDDSISFFATNRQEVASGYMPWYEDDASDRYHNDVRRIGVSDKSRPRGLSRSYSAERILAEARKVFPEYNDARVATDSEILADLKTYWLGETVEAAEKLREIELSIGSIKVRQQVKDMCDAVIAAGKEDTLEAWRTVGNRYKDFDSVDIPYDATDMRPNIFHSRILGGLQQVGKFSKTTAIMLNGQLTSTASIVDRYNSFLGGDTLGMYDLYAKQGNQLVIQGRGSSWNQLPLGKFEAEYMEWLGDKASEELSGKRVTTRDVAAFAKAKGYRSVVFYDIYDNGAYGSAADISDVYAFFYPNEDVKSADPITYDDNGNVIPLSERFNTEQQDIRYQDREISDLTQRRDDLPSSSEILADVFKSGKAYEKYAEHSQSLKKYKDLQVRLKNSEKRIAEIDAEIKKLRSQRAQSGKGTRMDELYRMRKTAENKVESFRKQMFAMEAGDLYNVVISESRRLVDKQRKEDAEKYREKSKERTQDFRERLEKQRKADAEKYREKSKERTQNIAKRGYIEMIEKRVKLLSKAITENSKDNHVPEIFKKTVGDFISAIDFSSKRALGGGAPTGKELSIAASMNAMADTLANSAQNPDLSTYLEACDLKGDVAEAFAEIAKKINDIALANGNNNALTLQQMTVEELKALSNSVRTITHLVSAANKLIGDNRYARVEDLFIQTVEDLKNFKEYSRDPKKVGYKLAKMFEWDNALPYYAFKRMGKAAFSLFEEFQDGFDDFAFKARDIVEYTEKLYNSKESRTWTDEIHEIKLDNDRTVYMSTADIMSLYCLSKRTQARNHIFQGGIRLNQTRTGHLVGEEKAKKKTYANNQQNVVIDEPTLLKILAKLTDRQREVADGLQKFMADECAKWGNEISMKRFGVPQFLDPTYFPITSSSLSLEKSENSTQEKTIYALLNASFTQKLNPHANNTVEVSDIFDVFATHAIEMAKYHAFAIPLIDMRKWENFRIKTGTNLGAQAKGFETKGVREMLKNAFGDEAERYITTFLKDINSLQDRERGADLLQSLASKYKVQAVAANINVALIQPISYIRVSAVMNPKYMLEEVKDTFKIREAIKKAEKHSGMMVWKSLGYRDVNIAASLSDKIKHTESMVEKLTENVTLKGAELADKLTWGAIWIACENEISDTQKGLAKGSPEYDKAVSRRFREVIYATQVVDSPLTKTQFMRGKTFWNSLTGSFMSEPSLSYNLFLDVATDIMDDKRNGKKLTSKHIKRLARAESVLLIGAFSEALIRSFLDALHDYDEEDEEYLDLYFSNFLETFLSSAFAPKTPILNAIYKAFAGAIKGAFTSSSGMDVVAFQKLGRLGRNIVRLFQGKDVSWTTFVKSVFDAFSSFSGIPISNVWREAKSIWNGIVGSQNPSALIK